MSLSLLHRSIEIIDEDILLNSKDDKSVKMASKIRKKKAKKGVEDTFKLNDKLKKSNIEQIRKEILNSRKNRTEENVEKLLRLSRNYSKSDTSEKLIQRAQKGRYISEPEKKKEEEKSIFTEEDFEMFEKDYFPDF